MTLPKWNERWEKPDLLKGKRGWALPDYITIAVAIVLVVISFGLSVLTNQKIRDSASRVHYLNEQQERQLGEQFSLSATQS